MPPKGKGSKPGKKKSKTKGNIERPSGNEALLQLELDRRVKELAEIKLRAQAIEEENNYLNEEAKRIRLQMNEYMHFMTRKTNVRQTKIVTLTDYHRQEIEDINRDKENMLKDYQQKKDELRSLIQQKRQLLAETNKELETLNDYKIMKEDFEKETQRLESEIAKLRSEHVYAIARMRANFEKEIEEQRHIENVKVEKIRQQADKEAEQFLYDQTMSIQNENVKLRKALQNVVKRTQMANNLKQRLEEEQLRLKSCIRLTTDLRKIRLDKVSMNIPDDSLQAIPH